MTTLKITRECIKFNSCLWALNDVNNFIVLCSLYFQTQALALTRPKTPKKDDSGSSPSRLSENLRSPVADSQHSRPSSKTPVHSTSNSEHMNNASAELNSSNSNANSNSKVSPSPVSEKSNHHSEGMMNNNGVGNHNQQYSSHSMNGPDKVLPSPSIDRKDFDFSKVNGKFLNFLILRLESRNNPSC